MPLWNMQSRSFLEMPVLPVGRDLVKLLSPAFTYLLLAGLLARVWLPQHRAFKWFTVAILSILILLDIHRLQIWVWFYLLWFVFFEHASGHGYRLLAAAMYTWAALNKMNIHFFQSELTEWIEGTCLSTNMATTFALGVLAICCEFIIGLSLIFSWKKSIFLVLVWALHLFIFVGLSWVMHWNSVVLPWNLVLPIVYTLWFYAKPDETPQSRYTTAGALIAGGGPLLYSAGLWPYTLSWMLYSGLQTELTLCADTDFTKQIHQKVQPHIFTIDSETCLVWHEWTFAEAGVPPFVHDATIRRQAEWWCNQNLPGKQYSYLLSHERFCEACSDLKRTNCSDQPDHSRDIGFSRNE